MSRTIGAATQSALDGVQLSPIGLVELEFGTGTLRLWTGYGSITSPDGRAWEGVGLLGRISALEETAAARATGLTLELSGVGDIVPRYGSLLLEGGDELLLESGDVLLTETGSPPIDVLAIAYGEEWQQRAARVYYGVLDDNLRWVGDLFLVREGVMDQMEIVEGEAANIRLTVESAFLDNERAEARRYTAEDQRSEHVGDAGCDQVAALQDKAVVWNLG